MRRPRSPLVRLLLGGILLLAAQQGLSALAGESVAAPAALHVGTDQIARARRTFVAENGRPPDADELRGLVDAEIDDEILYREARARGMDRRDPVVQRRLVTDVAFVDEDGTGASGDTGYAAALALGMDRGDVVVRRRLIARMRALLEEQALHGEPSEAELQAALERHAERFVQAPRVRLTQLQFAKESTQPGARMRAQALASALRARAAQDPAAPCAAATDEPAAPAASHLAPQGERDLARLFGAAFAHEVLALPAGRWSDPLASPLGLHVVCVEQHEAARTPPLAAVRNQVRALLLRERAQVALRTALDELRRRYDVQVADLAEGTG